MKKAKKFKLYVKHAACPKIKVFGVTVSVIGGHWGKKGKKKNSPA